MSGSWRWPLVGTALVGAVAAACYLLLRATEVDPTASSPHHVHARASEIRPAPINTSAAPPGGWPQSHGRYEDDPDQEREEQAALRDSHEKAKTAYAVHAVKDAAHWSEVAQVLASDGRADLAGRCDAMAARLPEESHLGPHGERPMALFEEERALVAELRPVIGEQHAEMLDRLEQNIVVVMQGGVHPEAQPAGDEEAR